ncbi:VanZ family protein, partial [Streptomyces sp. NPDC057616]|uniref:VanZ family protein n=1 Tax=Streptomyces sp. NPDC057616 TaxID=3346183 RepID=UPI00367B0460
MALPIRLLAMVCAFGFMVAFAVVLARLTLEPSPASAALAHTNLHPGRSLHAYLDQPALRDAVKQIGGNILLGVPFGILVPVVAPRARGLLRVLMLTALVMLLVEFAQGALITGRAFDIDDVILNTTGALIGYVLLGRRMSRAVHARERGGGGAGGEREQPPPCLSPRPRAMFPPPPPPKQKTPPPPP